MLCFKFKYFSYLPPIGEFLQHDLAQQPQTGGLKILHVTRPQKDSSDRRRTITTVWRHLNHQWTQSQSRVLRLV